MKTSRVRPRLNPLASAVGGALRRSGGFSLIELLLVAGVIAAGTAVVLSMAQNTIENNRRLRAQQQVQEVLDRTLASYQHSTNYELVSTAGALADGVFPPEVIDPASGEPRHAWGGAIQVAGAHRAGRPPGSALMVSLEDVPDDDCPKLAASLAGSFSAVVINDITIDGGMQIDINALVEACRGRDGSLIQFFWDDPSRGSPALGTCAGATTETRTTTCPTGELGELVEARQSVCLNPYQPAVPGPWMVVSNTCAPVCVAPAPSVESRAGTFCPAGQLGERLEERTVSWSCPAPTGEPSQSATPWVEVSNTCAPACVAPPPQTATRTLECPEGQLGSITESQDIAWSCPALTGEPTPTAGSWTVVENTCTPACVAPATSSNPTMRSLANETQTVSCPAGQFGSLMQTRSVRESGTTTISWTCPAPTGSATPSISTQWSGTYTYGDWVTFMGTCAACPAPTEESQTLDCPTGQAGSIEQTRLVSYTCPAGTQSLPSPSYGTWTTRSNTCTPTCVAPAPSYGTVSGRKDEVYYQCNQAPWAKLPKPSGTLVNYTGGPARQWIPAERDYVDSWTCAPGATTATKTRTYTSDWRATGAMIVSNSCDASWSEQVKEYQCPSGWSLFAWLPDSHQQIINKIRRVDGNGPNLDARIWVNSVSYGSWSYYYDAGEDGGTCAPCASPSAKFDCNGNRR